MQGRRGGLLTEGDALSSWHRDFPKGPDQFRDQSDVEFSSVL